MDNRNTQTIAYQTNFNSITSYDRDSELTQKRLNDLLAVNAEIALEKSLFRSEREKTEADMMINPMSGKQAFAYLGLLLGAFPPAAIFARFFTNGGIFRGEDVWIFGVVAIINLISATVGYFSGKLVGKIVFELEKKSWFYMIFALPFIGILWGILAGGAGGVIVFVFGAIFGAIFGAAVGAAALPIFTIFHRLVKKGDKIDRRQFLPLAFGVTFIICAFILSL